MRNQLVASATTPPSGWTKIAGVEKDDGTSDDGTLVASYRIAENTTEIVNAGFTGTSSGDWRSYSFGFSPGEYTTT